MTKSATNLRASDTVKSGTGVPHSKTWREKRGLRWRDSVLECGTPVPFLEGSELLEVSRHLLAS